MEASFNVRKNNGCVTLTLLPDLLPKVDVNFPHDTDLDVVSKNWSKRVKRIDYDRLVLILDDRGTSKVDLDRFSRVACHTKIFLTSRCTDYDFCHIMDVYRGEASVGAYYGKDFKRGLWCFEYQLDYMKLLCKNEGKNSQDRY
jgi:uncharacterized protein (DUF1919 family)